MPCIWVAESPAVVPCSFRLLTPASTPVHALHSCPPQVAIDLDAAQHFMTNAPDIPDGAVIWRRRMLLSRGYQVVSVPVPEWEQLRDSQRRQEHLQQQLRSAGLLAQPLPA